MEGITNQKVGSLFHFCQKKPAELVSEIRKFLIIWSFSEAVYLVLDTAKSSSDWCTNYGNSFANYQRTYNSHTKK